MHVPVHWLMQFAMSASEESGIMVVEYSAVATVLRTSVKMTSLNIRPVVKFLSLKTINVFHATSWDNILV
uniref:Uncharacterized protein n=1 Tax=Arion vulgaris TaxID=1028688 RepID=A0A0B6Z644_9EUPU